ncbi:MAG: Chorismate mutase, partial [Myxococcaceae bacterium]|nr:Chorismate mutase [Myxococcaceae bacterium]
RKAPWQYVFLVDVEGHRADPALGAALRAAKKSAAFLKVVGSYPRGDAPVIADTKARKRKR